MLFNGKKIKCDLKFENQEYTFEMDKNKTINDLINLFLENNPTINYPIMLRLNSNKLPFDEKDLENTLLSLLNDKDENLLFQVTKSYKCSFCSSLNIESQNSEENNFISKYCLNCNKYICNMCLKKNNANHNKHKLIDINPSDLKNSVRLWCINLIADLSNQITSFKTQTDFMNDSDFILKMELWKNNIISKINSFENLIKKIFEKFQNLRKYYQNLGEVYDKLMQNLVKNEREINDELFFESEQNKYRCISLDEAEEKIQKLKFNYEEIEKVKKHIKTIIEINNIKTMETVMVNIPMSFDKLNSSTYLIMDNINTFESEKNDKDDIDKMYKYPDFLNLKNNTKVNDNLNMISSPFKIDKNKKNENQYLLGNKSFKNKNRKYFISNNHMKMKNISNNNNINTIMNKDGGKLITQITKLSDIPASYSIMNYSKYLKRTDDNKNIDKNVKIMNLKGNEGLYLSKENRIVKLPKINTNNSTNIYDNGKNNVNVAKSANFNEKNNKLFRSMDNERNYDKKNKIML